MSSVEGSEALFLQAHARDRMREDARHIGDHPMDDILAAHLHAENAESQGLTVLSIVAVAVAAALGFLAVFPYQFLSRLTELPLH